LERHITDNDFIVGINFRHNAKITEFRCNHIELKVGDKCVVDAERGPVLGLVERGRMKRSGGCRHSLRNVIRKATADDLAIDSRNHEKEQSVYKLARKKADDAKLKIKISQVEMSFDEKRAAIYFTSDERVDFREMVKSIAAETNLRVEMRQVGIRDEAKMLGGSGICGFKLCCSGFLTDFAPVSIRMAKDQNMSLNPTKILGVCGRLMCCLTYEQNFYREMQKTVPRVGKAVNTPEGRGRVVVADFLRSKVSVLLEGEKGIVGFEAAQVSLVFPPQQQGKGKGKKQQGQSSQNVQDEPSDDDDNGNDDGPESELLPT
jgi:cell fate regulator YaaT (PSP1 superfamily)